MTDLHKAAQQVVESWMKTGGWPDSAPEISCLDRAISALREALAKPAVPEGWKLVPVKATREMLLSAGYPASADGMSQTGQQTYARFLAAAPQPKDTP